MKDTFVKLPVFRSSARTIMSLLLGLYMVFSLASVNAQTVQDIERQVDAEVNSFLSEIEAKQARDVIQSETKGSNSATLKTTSAETLSVYDRHSKRKIATVSADRPFTVVNNQANWVWVRFNQVTIKGWVSGDYVSVDDGLATVSASILNLRQLPSTSSMIVDRLLRGYVSKNLAQKDGFVQVFAPKSLMVALRKSDLAKTIANPNAVLEESDSIPTSTQQTIRSTDRSESAKAKFVASDVEAGERSHIIAPGDAISLLVFGEKDLSIENVRVPQGGQISLPLIGTLAVSGKTTEQVERDIFNLLSQGYVRNPRLSVSIFSYRPIFIRGAVRQTGSFPFAEGLTIAKAIALAGGSKNSASKQGVSILRDGTVIIDSLAIDSQVKISSGDVISVGEEFGISEDQATYVYLHGEVASPGEYLYRRGLTVEKAVVLAGGFTLRASRKKVSVTRYLGQTEGEEPSKLKKVRLYTPIQPGDIIDVGASWF